MKGKIRIMVIALTALILGFLVIMYIYNKPHEDISHRKPDFELSAVSLVQQFTENEQEANGKFLGKIIEVQGKVIDTEQSKENEVVITLDGNGINNVRCVFSDENTQDVEQFTNQQIVIKGICTGMLLDVVLNECVIVKEK